MWAVVGLAWRRLTTTVFGICAAGGVHADLRDVTLEVRSASVVMTK